MEQVPNKMDEKMEKIKERTELKFFFKNRCEELIKNNPFVKIAVELEEKAKKIYKGQEISPREDIKNHPDVLFFNAMKASISDLEKDIENQ